ncbi:MAG: rod shape-determining protein MreC [Clostridia bacterium]|nr:rod shape-determining protein MreC [Clostridia bacterium]
MERDKKGGMIGIIVTTIILILLIVFTNTGSKEISIIENIANTLIVPVQNGLTYLKNTLNNNDKFFENVNQLKSENEELKKKKSELEQTLREFEIMKNENDQLKQQLNLAEKYGEYKTVPGTIISRDISNYSKTIVINVGSDNGIQEHMTVIADEGLVGYVVSVTAKTAKIQTIVDSASATSCLASTTRDSMICKGTIENNSVLRANNIATNANIIQGDSVETSGLGGIYIKGIHIGKIKKIVEGTNKTDSYALVEAAVDFEKLETVLVITNQ